MARKRYLLTQGFAPIAPRKQKSNANGMGSAYFSYKIKGQNGISVVYVDAEKENDVWIYKKINFYKEKQSCDVIDLLAEE